MRCVAQQTTAFDQRFVNEREVTILQVAQAPVNEFGGCGTCATSEIALVDKRDAPAACRGIESDAGARNAAAEDAQIEEPVLERFEIALHVFSPIARWERGRGCYGRVFVDFFRLLAASGP